MDSAGYVYVLINASIKGLVKVGSTARDPEARAKELSAATGVAQPFTVVYSAYFNDCVAAEASLVKRIVISNRFNLPQPFEGPIMRSRDRKIHHAEAYLESQRALSLFCCHCQRGTVTEKPSRYWIKVKNSRYCQL